MTLDAALARALRVAPRLSRGAEPPRGGARHAHARPTARCCRRCSFDADYGAIGQTVDTAHSTYSFGATVRVPIFDGGRTQARRIEADAVLKQREAEVADFKGRIEYEVRAALLDLRAADEQLQAHADQRASSPTQRARAGARSLRRRRRQQPRGDAGAGSGRHRVGHYIAALYAHNLAKASLARALGIAESAVSAYLGGHAVMAEEEKETRRRRDRADGGSSASSRPC